MHVAIVGILIILTTCISMVILEIVADIKPNKSLEFRQSKLAFINQMQDFQGYLGFREKPGIPFSMNISWKSQKSLEKFFKSEHYKVFHGAIITLSENHNCQIIKSNQTEKSNKSL